MLMLVLSVQLGLERSLKRDLGVAVSGSHQSPGAKVSEPALNHLDQSAQTFVAKKNGPIALSHQHDASGSQSPLFVVDGASPEDFDEVRDTDPSIMCILNIGIASVFLIVDVFVIVVYFVVFLFCFFVVVLLFCFCR